MKFTVVYNVWGRALTKANDFNQSVFIRAAFQGSKVFLNTGVKIRGRDWRGQKENWISSTHPEAERLNQKLTDALIELEKFAVSRRFNQGGLSLDAVQKFFNRDTDTSLIDASDFNSFARRAILAMPFNSESTKKRYERFLVRLDKYQKQIHFKDVTPAFLTSFANFLNKVEKLSGATIEKDFDPMRKVCTAAVNESFLRVDPFTVWKLKLDQKAVNDRVYLKIEEIEKLKAATIDPALESTRAAWLFCFYAGVYYSDLRGLQWEDLKESDEGLYIDGERFKNDQSYIAPIHKFDNAVKIIQTQRGRSGDSINIFPGLISEQKYNKKLKKLAEAVGLSKNLMNKSARHSHIQFWIGQGVDAATVGKLVGHRKASTTKVYYHLNINELKKSVKDIDLSIFEL